MKKINKRDLRKTQPVGETSLTDQKFKNSSDINLMMKKFKKTGIPPIQNKTPRFADVSNISTLSEMYELAQVAQESFYELPAGVRKLMNNDPSKLEEFISDSENKEICLKHGLLVEKEAPKKDEPQKVVIVENTSSKGDE